MSQIEIFENERAIGYDQFVQTWIPNYSYFMEQLPKVLKDKEHKHILIVGCGTGNEIESLLKENKHWEITGIDPSPEMMQQAQDKLSNYKNVHLKKGLVDDLAMSDQYGAATLLLVLHFLEDNGEKERLLKSIADRLELDAVFILLDITGNTLHIQQNLTILKKLLPSSLEETQVNKRIERIKNELYAVSDDRLAELCMSAGFEKPIRFFQTTIYSGWIMKKMDYRNDSSFVEF